MYDILSFDEDIFNLTMVSSGIFKLLFYKYLKRVVSHEMSRSRDEIMKLEELDINCAE
jgi:hypothetical protein